MTPIEAQQIVRHLTNQGFRVVAYRVVLGKLRLTVEVPDDTADSPMGGDRGPEEA